jgi:hypothetical protein
MKIINDYGQNPSFEKWRTQQVIYLKKRINHGQLRRTLEQLELDAQIMFDLTHGRLPELIKKYRYPTRQQSCESSLPPI